jgi:MFS family permease
VDRFTASAWRRLRVALRAASATNGDDTAPPRLRAAEAAGYAGNGDAGASRRHRLAVTVVFAGNGMLFASLFARLPEVQARLGLSEGELGLALLGAPVGLVAAVWPAGAWVVRAGSRRVSAAGAAAFVAVVALPALAGGLAPLVAAMVLLGAASGTLDVAMNAQGVTVERRDPRRIFASLHAGFSFGALAGALSSGLAAEAGFALGLHLAAVGLVVGCAMAASIRAFLPDAGQPEDGAGFARPTGPLLAIGAVALCALLAEGALNDWSAVYLADVQGAAPGLAAAGLAAFSTAMGVGRLAGDRLAARVGGARLASSGLLVAAAGFAGAAAAPGAAASLIAFVTLGLGLAAVYPLCLRIAAEQPGIPPAAAIAAVTTTGYTGFLAGPPLVGFVAEATSLRISLVAVGTLCVAAAALARSASPGSRPPRPQASARARRRAAESTAR